MIQRRIEDLKYTENALADVAEKLTKRSTVIKMLLILLGALIATKEVTNQLIGVSNVVNIVIYTLAGLLIAFLAGIETAFKWEGKSVELKVLAANCRMTRREIEAEVADVLITKTGQQRLIAGKKLLDSLNAASKEVLEKAVMLGVNVILKVPSSKSSTELLALSDYVLYDRLMKHKLEES